MKNIKRKKFIKNWKKRDSQQLISPIVNLRREREERAIDWSVRTHSWLRH